MSAPTQRHIAHAIADLAHTKVVAAWRYLDTWAALEHAGVPATQRRDILDGKPEAETQALARMRQWVRDGERGALVVVGAQDCGKSYGAADWALERHRRGEATMWISCSGWGALDFRTQLRPLIGKAERADALVIDDAGCGQSQGEVFTQVVEGLLLARDQRPSLITGNMNALNAAAWLGPRVVSRLRVTGGIVHIEESLGMRERCLDGVCKVTGRGPAWSRAYALVSLIGCDRTHSVIMETVPDDWGGTYERATGRYSDRFDVGRELEARVSRARSISHSRETLRRAADLAGLDREAVLTKAAELVGTVSELDSAKVLGDMAATIAARMREDNERRSRECSEALAAQRERRTGRARWETGITSIMTAPEWTRGPDGRGKLKALGYSVKRRWDGHALYMRCSCQGKDPDHEPCAGTGHALKSFGGESEADAWECAARLCGVAPRQPDHVPDRARPLPPDGPSESPEGPAS